MADNDKFASGATTPKTGLTDGANGLDYEGSEFPAHTLRTMEKFGT